ncbi:MAG: acyl-CoA dehydrogenase family protein [Gemmatimonadales bacterium]
MTLDQSTLSWPFFADEHRSLAVLLRGWATVELAGETGETGEKDVDDSCRRLVRVLGDAGWLAYAVPAAHGGVYEKLDVRSLCILRETLASHSGLADFAFAMQGLGAGPISLFGSTALRKRYLPDVAKGKSIPAFAISESDAGSDVSAMKTTARLDGDSYIVDGEKTWISNGGIADFYVTFCKVTESAEQAENAESKAKFIALVIEPTDPGFSVAERIETIAPHPLAKIRFDGCRVPKDRVVGEPGRGLRVALGTLDVFRTTVAAAALGFARRALAEALAHASQRRMFGEMLADFQLTQAAIADMATEIDASALLVYRSAWARDNGAERVTREAAMAKMYSTEAAQRVIDRAVQLLGGRGVVSGHPVERLYREIRSLRIYEGTTEVQKLVIAGQVLDAYRKSEEVGG